MLKLGLIGCGVVADYGHLPAIVNTPGLSLHAVCDPNPANLERAKGKYQPAHVFSDPAAFFASGLDVVSITTPAPVHRQNVHDAAKHGVHVLCEKPLAMTEPEIAEMIAAMDVAKLKFFTGFTYRFAQPALRIKQLVDAGAIGRVKSLRLIYLWDCHGKYERDRESPSGFRCDASGQPVDHARRTGRMHEGGPMVDCGVHQIDLARWWIGDEVTRVRGIGAWADEFDCPDHVYAHMDHAGGQHTLVEISYGYAHTSKQQRNTFSYELIGDKGLIRYDRNARQFQLYDQTGIHDLPWGEEKGFGPMYAELERALRTGQPGNLPTGTDGLIATRIAREATEQAMTFRAEAS